MTPEPWPAHLGLEVFDEIDSTQTEARRRVSAGAVGPEWIVARRQTAGHGRRGRAWSSPSGNLMATWYARPDVEISAAPQVSFVAALAVADLIDRYLPGRCTLKWPNDPLLGGAKVAGILPDSAGRADGRLDWLMVGFGINLAVFPTDTPYPATSLAAHMGSAPDPDVALSILAISWERRFAAWRSQGFAAIRAAWLERAHGIGQTLEVRLPNESFPAVFEGLDASGALLARLPDRSLRVVAAGDVFPVAR
ncbi:MAG: biotin--[acetyl-CoA-carboxylase] ligase [Alphaproteobacteria bacterium]|nr:biotin--[acetyl-CoA-carboxylase] ligase [Alphaproteobacteria bacterium]